jgi:hypothetical protein
VCIARAHYADANVDRISSQASGYFSGQLGFRGAEAKRISDAVRIHRLADAPICDLPPATSFQSEQDAPSHVDALLQGNVGRADRLRQPGCPWCGGRRCDRAAVADENRLVPFPDRLQPEVVVDTAVGEAEPPGERLAAEIGAPLRDDRAGRDIDVRRREIG